MNPAASLLTRIAFAACACAGSGCASIVKGTTQEIPVASEPAGARISVNGSPAGSTPAKITLSRKQNHVVTIEKEGFQPENVAVTKSIGGAVVGNMISGGLIGWGVDAMTGAQYNLHPESIHVRLHPAANPTAAAPAAASIKDFIDELNKLDEMLVKEQVTPEEYAKLRAALFEKHQKPAS